MLCRSPGKKPSLSPASTETENYRIFSYRINVFFLTEGFRLYRLSAVCNAYNIAREVLGCLVGIILYKAYYVLHALLTYNLARTAHMLQVFERTRRFINRLALAADNYRITIGAELSIYEVVDGEVVPTIASMELNDSAFTVVDVPKASLNALESRENWINWLNTGA